MRHCAYANRVEQAGALALQVADQLHAAIQRQGKASLAVPGGTTPALFFEALAGIRLDWPKVHVTLTDERQVPGDSERSNARLLAGHLLARVPDARFIPLYGGSGAAALGQVADALRRQVLPLDVCVLGMGEDGHFASLFPGAGQLEAGLDPDSTEPLLEVTADTIPEPRISLTLAVLAGAQHVHLLITGVRKQEIAQQADARVRAGEARVFPIEALMRQAGGRLTIHYAP